jgi:hypothetical protein
MQVASGSAAARGDEGRLSALRGVGYALSRRAPSIDRHTRASKLLNRIEDQCDRLYRGMHREFLKPTGPQRIDRRIIPDVGAVSSGLAKLEGVDERFAADFEDKDQLVLRA